MLAPFEGGVARYTTAIHTTQHRLTCLPESMHDFNSDTLPGLTESGRAHVGIDGEKSKNDDQ